MLRDATYNLRFLIALPFAVVAHLCQDYVARVDERYASALNPDEEEL